MEVAGIEPAGPEEGTPVNNLDSAHSAEALIKILTNLTGEDRQMLSRIVESCGGLSNELKRVVVMEEGASAPLLSDNFIKKPIK